MNRDFSLLIGLLAALFGAVLLWAFLGAVLADPGARLADLALELLPRAGMANPATAVLLNYRAFDTLLELVLLFAAILGIWAVGVAHPGFVPAGAALRAMVAWAVPLLVLAAGYMLWVGFDAPGGAFQAGALLGAVGVLLRLAGDPTGGLPGPRAQRWLVGSGVASFVLVGLGLLLAGRGFLNFPAGAAKWLILLIEVAATLAIATTLAAAYIGGRRDPPA